MSEIDEPREKRRQGYNRALDEWGAEDRRAQRETRSALRDETEADGPESLESLASRWVELEIGREYPVAENFCNDCGGRELVFVVKLEATDGALAGAQVKTSARAWPYLRCTGCGRESKGK